MARMKTLICILLGVTCTQLVHCYVTEVAEIKLNDSYPGDEMQERDVFLNAKLSDSSTKTSRHNVIFKKLSAIDDRKETKSHSMEATLLHQAIRELNVMQNENKQMAEKIEELEGKMDKLDFGYGGKVAFTARLDHALTRVKIGQIIKFQTVLLNEGSGYDARTGYFTAPYPGVYLFSYFVAHNTDPPGQTWARLMKNGQVVNAAVADAMRNYLDIQGGNVGIVRLNKGGQVWIESWHQNNARFTAGYYFSTFSGVWIYP